MHVIHTAAQKQAVGFSSFYRAQTYTFGYYAPHGLNKLKACSGGWELKHENASEGF